MILRTTLLTIIALTATVSSALACAEHDEEMPEEWLIESDEELPHAEGPMVPRVDKSEFLVDIDEAGGIMGTATLRLHLNSGTIEPNVDEVALTVYHAGGTELDVLYAGMTEGRVLEFTVTNLENIFDGEWTGYIQAIDGDGVWGEGGSILYFEPIRTYTAPQEPVDGSDTHVPNDDDMMGCDTANASAATGLPMIFGMTVLFLGLIRRRPAA